MTVYTRNFVCMNVRAKPFYVHVNQCTKISDLSSPVIDQSRFQEKYFDFTFDQELQHETGVTHFLPLVCFYTPGNIKEDL